MYLVRNFTGEVITWRVDYTEAAMIAAPCPLSRVVPDNGGQHLHPEWRPKLGSSRHPYDQEALDAFAAKRDALIAAWKAGCNR